MALIKWAGGKNQLLSDLMKKIPLDFNTYVEPFVGSGALFFAIKPERSIINDVNSELINLYKTVKEKPIELEESLIQLQNEYNELPDFEEKKEYYYEKREEFNGNILSEILTVKDAALFIFLNKTCFNGLYRVNKKGYFNVPYGKRKKINLIDKDGIDFYSKALRYTHIEYGDFEKVCKSLQEKDFVYFDSPYFDTFDTYQAGGFPKEEHIRLAKLFNHLTQKGVYCMLSNSNTEFIKDLYKEYDIEVVEVKRMINRNGNDRTGTEIIVRNF